MFMQSIMIRSGDQFGGESFNKGSLTQDMKAPSEPGPRPGYQSGCTMCKYKYIYKYKNK